MGIRFTADEILSIAEQIERNGIAFYAAAASTVASPSLAELLTRLSRWEVEHEKTFAALRRALPDSAREPVTFDPDNELGLYLQATANLHVFSGTEDPRAILGEQPTTEHILELAMGKEKDSIVFYTGLRPFITPLLGGKSLDEIIAQEYGHLRMLEEQRASLN